MNRFKTYLTYILFVLVGITLFAVKTTAHSGRTNSEGCHNDYIHGGYHCHNGGSSGGSSYSTRTCTFNGTKYSSGSEASSAYYDLLRQAVTKIYLIDLERKAETKDYSYWADKYRISLDQVISCSNWPTFSEKMIHEEVIKSKEYEELQSLKSYKAEIRQAYIHVLGRVATEEEVNSIAEIKDIERDINIVKAYLKTTDEYQKKNNPFGFYANKYKWWIAGILIYLIIIVASNLSEKRKRTNKG